MKVTSVTNGVNMSVNKSDVINQIENTLLKLAKQQNVSVDELVDGAQNASNPTPTQERVINLANRLDKLKG